MKGPRSQNRNVVEVGPTRLVTPALLPIPPRNQKALCRRVCSHQGYCCSWLLQSHSESPLLILLPIPHCQLVPRRPYLPDPRPGVLGEPTCSDLALSRGLSGSSPLVPSWLSQPPIWSWDPWRPCSPGGDPQALGEG